MYFNIGTKKTHSMYKQPNLDIIKRKVASLASNTIISTMSSLQQRKATPILNLVLVSFLVSLLIFADEYSVFPRAGVWDGDKGGSVSVTTGGYNFWN